MSRFPPRVSLALAAALLGCLPGGCGSNAYRMAPVRGRVTCQGKPAAGAIVILQQTPKETTMFFNHLFRSPNSPSTGIPQRRRSVLRSGAHRAARGRRHAGRRLFLEGLEERSLMAFNFLAEYATGAAPYSPYDVKLEDVSRDGRPESNSTSQS